MAHDEVCGPPKRPQAKCGPTNGHYELGLVHGNPIALGQTRFILLTMSIGLLFWVIMIIGLVFGLYTNRTTPLAWAGNNLVLWILLALLGWAVFGPAVHR